MTKTTEQFAPYDRADYLVDIEAAAAYLEAALEEAVDDPAYIAQALAPSPDPATSAGSPVASG
jgi:DNA-binding phage protein